MISPNDNIANFCFYPWIHRALEVLVFLMRNNKVEKSEYILPTCQMSELVNCQLMCGKSLPMFYLTFLSLLCSPLLLYK